MLLASNTQEAGRSCTGFIVDVIAQCHICSIVYSSAMIGSLVDYGSDQSLRAQAGRKSEAAGMRLVLPSLFSDPSVCNMANGEI